jgi:hypothetical protein
LTVPYPSSLGTSETTYDLLGPNNEKVGTHRAVTFTRPDGQTAFVVGIASNPGALSLEEWIRAFPGWPSEPREVAVSGTKGLYFEVNQMGEKYPGVYFIAGDKVVGISGNVFGVGGGQPTITDRDFQSVLEGVGIETG